jgi:hypothetical protein
MVIIHILSVTGIIGVILINHWHDAFQAGWNLSVPGSYDSYHDKLDYKKPIFCAIPVESILGKLLVVPVRDTRTILHSMSNLFPSPGAPWAGHDCREG